MRITHKKPLCTLCLCGEKVLFFYNKDFLCDNDLNFFSLDVIMPSIINNL